MFESLSYRYMFRVDNFPERWLPLIHLYDPDLPLYPITYFHVVSNDLETGQPPSDSDRAFGYIEKINHLGNGKVDVCVVTNKNFENSNNSLYHELVLNEIKERLGLNNPVTRVDICSIFSGDLKSRNEFLSRLWDRVVANAYGDKLPFGRLWDEVLGLTRFVASWYSPSGRKGELIQTHYFASKFGVRIQSAGEIPQLDFYLLPTISELTDPHNYLNSFRRYKDLVTVSDLFTLNFCSTASIDIDTVLSKFSNPAGGQLDTEKLMGLLERNVIPNSLKKIFIECFNSFDKGPSRTVLFLMMLSDLRSGRLKPNSLTASQLCSSYKELDGSYQSPKALNIYAQQGFGNVNAIPIDTWIETFFKYPLKIASLKSSNNYAHIVDNSINLGKLERLLWVAGQARKVHSSACNDLLWCTKYSSNKKPESANKKSKRANKKPRGANPLACGVCLSSIREVCPAYLAIKNMIVSFNSSDSLDNTVSKSKRGNNKQLQMTLSFDLPNNADYTVFTSEKDNNTPNQNFVSCKGNGLYGEIEDDFSPADVPTGFSKYNHVSDRMTVEQFINTYC